MDVTCHRLGPNPSLVSEDHCSSFLQTTRQPLQSFHRDIYCSGSVEGCWESSALLEILAGIIQGSGIGPASYVVNSSDLAALTPGNFLCKYADDTYNIISSDNVDGRSEELVNVDTCAQANNLTLNRAKSQETVFTDKQRKPHFQLTHV